VRTPTAAEGEREKGTNDSEIFMNLGAGGGVRVGGILTPVKSVNIFPWKIEPSLFRVAEAARGLCRGATGKKSKFRGGSSGEAAGGGVSLIA
jgi:hypothetical protein